MQTYLFLKHKLTLVGGGEYFFCACQEIVDVNMGHVGRTIPPRAQSNKQGWGVGELNDSILSQMRRAFRVAIFAQAAQT